jgi:hypothetical protein
MKTTNRLATAANVALGSALLIAASGALAQNAVRGKQLYESRINPAYLSCSDGASCHGPNPLADMNNIRGANPAAIIAATNAVPLMSPLRGLISATDAADMAAYIANPAAANASAITASATSLAFGPTQVGTNNTAPAPASVTLTNSGGGTLTITAINKSGTNAADFTATGTCVSAAPVNVAPGASCTLSATFMPSASGTRTATLTVASNAATNPAIALSGMGSSVPVPSVNLSRTSIAFATQTVATASAAQAVTLTNSGSAPLTVTQVASSPTPEFSATSNCVGTINAGASCTINVTFAPTAAGDRSGSLTITSNAGSSPNAVALTGISVLTPSPIATVQPNTVTFPMTTVGVTATARSTTLTNIGNAPLQISAVALGGANAGDFRMGSGSTCVTGTMPVGATCRVEVAFQPRTFGSKSAVVTVSHNASSGATAVNVSGTAGTASATANGSSALAPSNVGGIGSVSLVQLVALALTLLLVPPLRRRRARR